MSNRVKEKKLGLALGAGGARGFCHLGVLEILAENNIPVQIVTGCSMGALAAGCVAAEVPLDAIRKAVRRISNMTVFDIDLLRAHRDNGFAKGVRAMRVYRKLVGEKLIEESNIKFAAIAADIQNGRLHTFTSGEIWKAVRASMSIPGVFTPVREGDMVLVDGGVMRRIPINEARELGADVVIAVDALGPPYADEKIDSIVKVVEASYSYLDWRAACEEGKAADVLIVPRMGAKSMVGFKNNEDAIHAGREATIAALPKILELLS